MNGKDFWQLLETFSSQNDVTLCDIVAFYTCSFKKNILGEDPSTVEDSG